VGRLHLFKPALRSAQPRVSGGPGGDRHGCHGSRATAPFGRFHGLLNDISKEKVMADIKEWIEKRL